MRKTYIKMVSASELSKYWQTDMGTILRFAGGIAFPVLVRCNKKGIVNWDTTAQYSLREVIGQERFQLVLS